MREHAGASTFSKGLRVLSCFETAQRNFSMAEISRLTGFDRATTRRLCLSLVETGFLNKVDQNLSLTPKILAVAGGYLAANDIGISVQPVLDQFSKELRGELSLAVRDGDRAIYVAKSKTSMSRLTFGFTVGSSLPLLHTAVGRMLLARCRPDIVEGILERIEPRKFTEKTELDPQKILAAITRSGHEGYCYLKEEFETGAAAVAVSVGILNGTEAVVGTTNTANKIADATAREEVLDILRQTAMALRRLSIFS